MQNVIATRNKTNLNIYNASGYTVNRTKWFLKGSSRIDKFE